MTDSGHSPEIDFTFQDIKVQLLPPLLTEAKIIGLYYGSDSPF